MKVWELQQRAADLVDNHGQRIGQALYNVLSAAKVPGIEEIAGTLDDPYQRIVNWSSGKRWMAAHLVHDDFDGDVAAVVGYSSR